MKNVRTTIGIIGVVLSLFGGATYAATATPSATPTTGSSKQVEDLKERLATKVAELRQSERRAMYGTVKTATLTTITIETKTKDIKIELTDTITVIQNIKGERTKLTVDDVAKGDVVTVFGDYDATLDLLKAKVIFIDGAVPTMINGEVTDVDRTGFTLTLKTADGQSIVVDIENGTKTLRWTQSDGIAKYGFSKVALGDTVHVVGTTVPKKDNRISATRLLDIGNLTGIAPTATPSATPKIMPKVTPTPTP